MLSDLYRSCAVWRSKQFERSRFHQDLEDFANWLQAAHYTPPIIRHHLLRLDRTLQKMPAAAPGATYTAEQLQVAFGKNHAPRSRRINFLGTQRAFQSFLASRGRLKVAIAVDRFADLCDQYRRHLIELRGFSPSTLNQHVATILDFLRRALPVRRELRALNHKDIEQFIALKSRENTRHSLQHVVAHLRAFLRYCHDHDEIPSRLDVIDTPRTYRGELPPRALAWPLVQSLLRSIDRRSKAGERDYAALHLMAHYGLRPAEVVTLRLDAVDWTTCTLWVEQRKTRSDLVLPLAPVTVRVLRRYLEHDRGYDISHHPELFLRKRCPAGPLSHTGICEMFARRARRSGLNLRGYSPYSLRHAFAMRLLTRGVGVKAIGDVLGHRNLESTCVYLRLDVKTLRDVALDVPQSNYPSGGCHG